jgi:hypothetical protein
MKRDKSWKRRLNIPFTKPYCSVVGKLMLKRRGENGEDEYARN